MTFGERLKQLREEKGIKQIELAKFLNISNVATSDYENNKSVPKDYNSLIKLANYFEVSLDFLLDNPKIIYKELSDDEKRNN